MAANRFTKSILLLFLLSFPVFAEVAVIVHPSNTQTLSDTDIKNLFTGKQKSFPNGDSALVLILLVDDPHLTAFNTNGLGKTDSQLKSYWAKMTFTGKGTPPKEVASAEMLTLVAQNPNTVGIIDSAKADNSVRVVAKY